MKKLLLGTAALAVLAMMAPASAADLAARPYTKAPPVPYIAPTTWSGLYLGGFGGYGWASGSSGSLDLTGGFGGGTLGYNWQNGNIVFGLEADVAGGDISASDGVPGVDWAKSQINAFGTVRGRIGIAASPEILLYATGGYAWANNKISADDGVVVGSASRTHSGWTVGAGLEYMFAPNWSAKVEYLYADLDGQTYTIGPFTGPSDRISLNSVKAGVNYHFNWGGPVAPAPGY